MERAGLFGEEKRESINPEDFLTGAINCGSLGCRDKCIRRLSTFSNYIVHTYTDAEVLDFLERDEKCS
jgi:hypothetical protein